MLKGDIVLISFPFTNLSGNKLRPAVVLACNDLDITVCFVTSQISKHEPTDVTLIPNPLNGLKKTSLIRVNKIATLELSLIKGRLGYLSQTELEELNFKLKVLFQLV